VEVFDPASISGKITNKKLWEVLITFVSYHTHLVENDGFNNSYIVACIFVTARTCLPSRCPAPMGDMHTDTEKGVICLTVMYNQKCRNQFTNAATVV
jgi:hypothetical protein